MQDLIIEGTDSTPYVSFKIDGELKIGGKSLPEDAKVFYDPIFEWASEYSSDFVIIDVRFEYFNTSSSKQIYELLKIFKNNTNENRILINWYYEEGDLDVLESGQYFESLLKIPFKYIEYAEIF
ncbi:MAG: DUF1987 domain-containing protein [Bacteroidales bacterium]|nr:DUF1987 domain-containing protein [Bacteroidales bacterium]